MKVFTDDIKKRTLTQIILYCIMVPLTIATMTIFLLEIFSGFAYNFLINALIILAVLFVPSAVIVFPYAVCSYQAVNNKKPRDLIFLIVMSLPVAFIVLVIIGCFTYSLWAK